MALQGKFAIYREGGLIKYTKIEEVAVDDSYLSLTLLPTNASGFSSRISNVFKIGANLEFLRLESKYIAAAMVNWCLVFCPFVVSRLLQIGNAGYATSYVHKAFISMRRSGFKINRNHSNIIILIKH